MTNDPVPESLGKLGSEYFREASVLVLVFGFLDGLAKSEGPPVCWPAWTVLIFIASGALFLAGYACETEWWGSWGAKK